MLEIFLILLFILINGFFAGSEIAVVTSRKTKIETLIHKGNESAQILYDLKKHPDRFLATVQIGVTVVSAIASAIGGATAYKVINPLLASIPVKYISASSEAIAIGIVVVVISYLSLILGELVPKSIALMNPEKVGLFVARPILLFSKVSSFFVSLLTISTNVILKPFGRRAFTQRAYVSQEEIKLLIKEGRDRGIFEPAEQELIHSVFEFTDISVNEVMVPLGKVEAISLDLPLEKIIYTISQGRYSRYPVYSQELNNIKGVLYAKDVFKRLAQEKEIIISKLLRAPYFVPETMKISHLLQEMQKKSTHLAIVVDEYGTLTGIVTIEDLLEEIVGEIRDEFDVERPVINIGNGTFIVDASIHLRDLKEDYDIEIPESTEYDSLGGFIITTLQRIPEKGDTIAVEDKRLSIIEMIGNRVSKVKLEYLHVAESGGKEEEDKKEVHDDT